MPKRALSLLLLLVASALVLSACGGGGGSSDEGQIEEAIETAATTSNASTCTELQTQQFTEQTTSTEGSGAVKACEEDAKEGEDAESVEIAEVEVSGSEATAEVTFEGSSFDGQSLELGLLKESGDWKLNEVVGFTKLDKPALIGAFEKEFKEEGGVSPEIASCIEEGIEESSQPEIEELIISGSSTPIEELAQECS